jgi:hypothetical protein
MAFDQRLRAGLSEGETGQLEALLTCLRNNVSFAAARSSARSMPSRFRRPDWPALATVTMRLTFRLEIQRRSSKRSSC